MSEYQILAFETSGTTGSVALLQGNRLLAQQMLDGPQRTAQTLAPAIRDLLAHAGWKPSQVGLVAVTTGPGSFTGLRIGVTTAKTFAYATGADLLGVHTLEVIADQAPNDIPELWVTLNAQRGELFAAHFRRDEQGIMRPTTPTRIVVASQWLTSLPAGTHLADPKVERFEPDWVRHLHLLDAELARPTAHSVGRVAARYAAQGRRDSIWSLVPQYFRRSAAEEKWEQKHRAASVEKNG